MSIQYIFTLITI